HAMSNTPCLHASLPIWPVDLRTPIDRVSRERRTTSVQSVEVRRADGTLGLFDIHFAPLIDDDGSVVGTAVNFIDVTQTMHLRSEDRKSTSLNSSNERIS